MNGEPDTMYYIHKDYLGSYDVITDEQGNVLERLSFDPWGRRRNPTDWTYNSVPSSRLFDRGYTGHEYLDIFGLINMNGRVYDPWLGRFPSPDPFVQAPGNNQSYNRYSYCLNNPLKYTDPSGYTNHPNWWDPAEVVCWEAYAWLNTTGTSGGSAQMNRGPSMSDIDNYNTYCAYYDGVPVQMASFSQYYYDGYYSSLYGMKSDYPHQFNNVISGESKNNK
jgi:RHS repeat-associated protein